MKPFHRHTPVRSINKEKAIRTAYLKALSHPGEVAWVAEHGGNFSTDALHQSRYKKQVIFAACLIEDGEVCRWHYVGFTNSNPTEVYQITEEAGFPHIGRPNIFHRNREEDALQDLKNFLIVHSGKFMERMPLYINHKREDTRTIARKVLSGK